MKLPQYYYLIVYDTVSFSTYTDSPCNTLSKTVVTFTFSRTPFASCTRPISQARKPKIFYHSMVSILSSYRETQPTNSTTTSRYLPTDFPILTNRSVSSPQFTPDFAHEPHAAECINNGRTATTADKRAITSPAASHSPPNAPASQHKRDIRKSSWSSVKEEKGGKSQAFPHPNDLAVFPHYYLKILY